MPPARFDILFSGELIEGADPGEVRQRLQQSFKLPDEAVTRLFSGNTVVIKQAVDAATASRYREIFRDAKALVQVRPVVADSAEPPESAKEPPPEGREESTAPESGQLRLATPAEQSKPLERSTPVDAPDIDTSNLSLVPGQDWTLEDCQPSDAPAAPPDTSHLSLAEPAPEDREEPKD